MTRKESVLYEYKPQIILQSSIKIGTATKPVTDEGSYDVDEICNLKSITKRDITQKELKSLVGTEIKSYALAYDMKERPHDGKRCWTLNYVDEANFYIDLLPTIDDTTSQLERMKVQGLFNESASEYLALTDKRHPGFATTCDDWLTANPVGYATWFLDMAQYEEFRVRRATAIRASIEEIKVYQVKAPLQRYAQLLKRHRDIYFDGREDEAPSSVTITTLLGLAYNQVFKTGWYEDFLRSTKATPEFIEKTTTGYRLMNSSNKLENFLEEWGDKDYKAFCEWHSSVLKGFLFGDGMPKHTFGKSADSLIRTVLGLSQKEDTGQSDLVRKVSRISHHQKHDWIEIDTIPVVITAEKSRKGFQYKNFRSGDPPRNGPYGIICAQATGNLLPFFDG